MVELQPSKLEVRVRFPSPAFSSTRQREMLCLAAVAQSVECVLGKDEVVGSSPTSSFQPVGPSRRQAACREWLVSEVRAKTCVFVAREIFTSNF